MGPYQLDAFVHLVAAVLLTGYTLFGAIMALALSRRFDRARTLAHLETVRRSRWPHVLVPWNLRLPWPYVGWAFLVVLAVTGALAGTLAGSIATGGIGGLLSPPMATKLALFVLLLAGQALLTRRPSVELAYANLAVTLLIVAISANLLR